MIKLTEKIRIWAALPVGGKKIAGVVFYALLFATMACALCIRKLDSDSFYMIRTGQDIISNGFPEHNPYAFVEGQAFPIQQWLYCVVMATIYNSMGQSGIILFGAAQIVLLYTLIRKKISNAIDDGIWTCVAAALPLLAAIGYVVTVRPENITLSLLVVDGLLIDKYEKTNKPVYLYLIPIALMIEMNVHASMWVFHFCVLAAHLCPSVSKAAITPSNLKANKHVFVVIAMMVAALFANPNGIGIAAYPFLSLDTFRHIAIIEQQPTAIFTMQGMVFVVLVVMLTAMVAKRTITSTTLYVTLGFLVLGAVNYHSSMFLLIAMTYIMTDISRYLASKAKGRKLSDTMNNSVWILFPMMLACVIATNKTAYDMGYVEYYMSIPELDYITDYIKEKDKDLSANVMNEVDIGPYLEYKGLSNLYTDTRPELLSSKVNGNVNMIEVYTLMEYGVPPETLGPKTIEELLETCDIQYLILYTSKTSWPVLKYYLDNTDDYVKVDTIPKPTENTNDDAENTGEFEPKYVLYERRAST